MLLLFCRGTSGTAFALLGTRLLWVPPPLLCALLSWFLCDTFCFVRDPNSLGPSPLIVCFTVLASLGHHFVLLGSRILWVPPQTLCASAFLSWLLWDSFCFVRVPASLVPSPLLCFFVLYCPGFSGTAFISFRVPASPGPSPTLVCFCFSVVATFGQPLLC